MFVLVDGQLHWDQQTARFDPEASNAAPPVLTEAGALPFEPLFIDVSNDAPWDYRAPEFREKVTALAAPIHGKPKDQLASDDLREQRRFRRGDEEVLTDDSTRQVKASLPNDQTALYPDIQKRWDANDWPWKN